MYATGPASFRIDRLPEDLPRAPKWLIRIIDDDGLVTHLGVSVSYLESYTAYKCFVKEGGPSIRIPRLDGMFWSITPERQRHLVTRLNKLLSWPWIDVSVGGGPIAGSWGKVKAEQVRCGTVTASLFPAGAAGAYEFARNNGFDCSQITIDGTERLASAEARPAGTTTTRGDPDPLIRDLAPPTVTFRKRGWVVDIVLNGDDLATAITLIADSLPHQVVPKRLMRFPISALSEWIDWAERLKLSWVADGFDPAEVWVKSALDHDLIPGWNRPTRTGRLLRDFQKLGVQFITSRGGRAVLADEMGLGKTAQSIATAAALKAERILIVSPASLKSVWLDEIEHWHDCPMSQVQVLETSRESPRLETRFLICAYDQIIVRAQTWRAASKGEFELIQRALDSSGVLKKKPESRYGFDPGEANGIEVDQTNQLVKFGSVLEQEVIHAVSKKLKGDRQDKWEKLHATLRGELVQALTAWAPDMLILDEAHRVKSSVAKRTAACIQLSRASRACILLSGTPVQNRTSEPAVLVHVCNPECYTQLHQVERISLGRVKEMLSPVLLRRRKIDVLKELPPVTEQVVRIVIKEPVMLGELMASIRLRTLGEPVPIWATDLNSELQWLAAGWSCGKVLGLFERARSILGLVKAASMEVTELVEATIESKGCVVVFTAHHAASDELSLRLGEAGKSVVIADGRLQPRQRAAAVKSFQSGQLDCLICGMEAMGEGVTLHRADTTIFVETALKPSTLIQARDRLHRIGQKRNVQAIHVVSDHAIDQFFQILVANKASIAAEILGEDIAKD